MKGSLRIGTSGWHYPHWQRRFYPEGMKARDFLAYYAEHFPAVEINNTFYRLPKAETLEAWAEGTPDGFLFAVKASRYITHFHKLQDRYESYNRFFSTIRALGDKLGPLLFQLPGKFQCNPERLDGFFRWVPDDFQVAFEFRDESWLNDEIYKILEKHGAALCIYDFDGRQSPAVTTAKLVYVRLHGPSGRYSGSYSDKALKEWAAHAQKWQRQGHEVHFYFDNDDKALAVGDAQRLSALCGVKSRARPRAEARRESSSQSHGESAAR